MGLPRREECGGHVVGKRKEGQKVGILSQWNLGPRQKESRAGEGKKVAGGGGWKGLE